jgi:arsenite methyltransferase
MKKNEETKKMVREKYSLIAEGIETSCCDTACCGDDVINLMADDYKKTKGYVAEADLSLGCGLPVEQARIKKGDVVLDLGSGAGNDCFIARHETGEEGKVIGVDMTPAMVSKARTNAQKLGISNIEFREGDIEDLPVSSDSVDVVISNCVLNLVPDKQKAFGEIYRVLKSGGHFSISDIVLEGNLPDSIMKASEMYAGCVSGATEMDAYMKTIENLGFANITIQKKKKIILPDEVLLQYLSPTEMSTYRASEGGIYSITVFAKKEEKECCDKTSCCK